MCPWYEHIHVDEHKCVHGACLRARAHTHTNTLTHTHAHTQTHTLGEIVREEHVLAERVPFIEHWDMLARPRGGGSPYKRGADIASGVVPKVT